MNHIFRMLCVLCDLNSNNDSITIMFNLFWVKGFCFKVLFLVVCYATNDCCFFLYSCELWRCRWFPYIIHCRITDNDLIPVDKFSTKNISVIWAHWELANINLIVHMMVYQWNDLNKHRIKCICASILFVISYSFFCTFYATFNVWWFFFLFFHLYFFLYSSNNK